MLQGALIKFDKTVFLRQKLLQKWLGNVYIAVHETSCQKKYGLLINDLLLFTLGLFRSLNNF